MATRELYHRQYEANVSVELRVYRDRFSLTVFRPNEDPRHVGLTIEAKVGRYAEAQAAGDYEAEAAPVSGWARILECPICEARDVPIRRHDVRDEFQVNCPRCGLFDVSGCAITVLADVREGAVGSTDRLDDLQYGLAHGALRVGDVVTAESWQWFADEGRRLRGVGAVDGPAGDER